MKFAICNELFEGWKIEDVFSFARSAGYEGVEIAPFTLADDVRHLDAASRSGIKDNAARVGIEIVGLHWLLVKPEGLHVASKEEAVRIRTRDYLVALVDFCSDIGGKVCVFGSPKQRSRPEEVAPEEHFERAAKTFSEAARRAKEKGVVIAMEPLTSAETNFVNTRDEAVELIRRVESSAFRLHLDMKAMCSEKKDPAQIVRESKGLLVHFHANDTNRQGPGMGDIDMKPVAKALLETGYEGWVSVEAFDYSPGAEETARRSIKYLKEIFS